MRLHVILLGALLSVPIVHGWRSFKVLFTSFPFEVNKDYLDANFEVLNSAGETTINCHMNVLEQMDDVSLIYGISLEISEGNFTVLVNRTVNFCKFLISKSGEPVIRIIYDDMLKHGNFFKNCPIKKGIYYVHDFKIDEEMLPSYVPETSLIVDILLTLPNKSPPVFEGKLHGRIDKSKGFNNLKIFSLG